ncbi:MAG: hypothetical protein R3266_00410, partial [Gemmatimonadota bacterium]|nr:hypothetical protein [Gemmatimonadota bacterium]
YGRLWKPAVATAAMGLAVWLVPLASPGARVGRGVGVFALAALAVGVVRRDDDGAPTLAV